jgi:hypothetical protein
MVQTRRQAASRPATNITTAFLKEVRIPAAAAAPKRADSVISDTPSTVKDASLPPLNTNAQDQLSAINILFSSGLRLITRLYAPSAITKEALELLDTLHNSLVNSITSPDSLEIRCATKPNPAAVQYVLEEVYKSASRAPHWQRMDVLAHAAWWALALWLEGGELEGQEYSEGVAEVHMGMYRFVRVCL